LPSTPADTPVADNKTSAAAGPGDGRAAPRASAAKSRRKKHHARIEHKVRGRIRIRVPSGRSNPEVLEMYREIFSAIPGVVKVDTKSDTGSIVIQYDPNREHEFEQHFHRSSNEHLEMAEAPRPPDDEVDKLANKIEAEAEFLAAHSRLARTTVDFFKAFDRELKLATSNTLDLKIVLAGGLAAYTFLEIGGGAATPMWVTLALFSLNHFAELQTDHRAELARADAST
jgi:hypothetical protein